MAIEQNSVYQTLSKVRLDRTFYPFNLKGEDYLKSTWKRGLDATVARILLPLAEAAAGIGRFAMWLENPSLPTTLDQKRIGIDNQEFDMHKIRTQDEATDNGVIKPSRVGRVLRKFSIDELLQLRNVVEGDMSLVGRRPTLRWDYRMLFDRMVMEVPYERARRKFGFTDEEWKGNGLSEEFRQQVAETADFPKKYTTSMYVSFVANKTSKPGLTGLYQILGRRDVKPEHRVALDLYYERNASLGMDLAILLSTIPAVISTRGAR